MPQLKIVYWRDIPGQVVIREGRRNTRLRLSPRFSKAIERAAYRLKKSSRTRCSSHGAMLPSRSMAPIFAGRRGNWCSNWKRSTRKRYWRL